MLVQNLDARATIFIMAVAHIFAEIFTVEVAHSGEELTGTPHIVCVAQYTVQGTDKQETGANKEPRLLITRQQKFERFILSWDQCRRHPLSPTVKQSRAWATYS